MGDAVADVVYKNICNTLDFIKDKYKPTMDEAIKSLKEDGCEEIEMAAMLTLLLSIRKTMK
jgi:hypothetical protein